MIDLSTVSRRAWIVTAVAAFGVTLVFYGGMVAIGVSLSRKQKTEGSANAIDTKPPGGPNSKPLTREEFRRLVFGSDPRGVTLAVGPPDHSSTNTPSSRNRSSATLWAYKDKTIDPKTGELDHFANVWFHGGHATNITFTGR